MVGRTNVGGGNGGIVVAAWAYIGVTYPAGSICTATNGTLTFTAENTSGLYVFQIPQPISTPETWTVSCTNGSKNKSETVSIATQYQNAIVTLRYSRLPAGYQEVEYIEATGTQYIAATSLWTLQNVSNYQIDIQYMVTASNGNQSVVFGFGNTGVALTYIANAGHPQYVFGNQNQYYSAYGLNEKISAAINNENSQIVEEGVVLGSCATITSNSVVSLFCASTSASGSYLSKSRIYAFILTNKTTQTVEHNLVPCYRTSDDEAGFYDLSNNTFVTNDGSGTFIVGADV